MRPINMSESNVVQLYERLDKQIVRIQGNMNEPYLDSLAICLEALFYQNPEDAISVQLDDVIREDIAAIGIEKMELAEVKQAIQLVILKGMQKTTQHQHVMTPETISLFMGYLAEKLTKRQTEVRLFDPVSGTGNLLLTVMGHLEKEVEAFASEVDVTLLKISLLYANFMEKQVEFFHQDSLRPLLLDPVDLVVADLPVGYYPDDSQAETYELNPEQGHAYAHHLLIEQSLTYTKPGGYLLFLIPEALFTSEQSDALNTYLQKHAHIIGVLQMSETTFKSKKHQKSVFILQKKGQNTKGVKQPLLAMLPSFKDTAAMSDMMDKINQWFEDTDFHDK